MRIGRGCSRNRGHGVRTRRSARAASVLVLALLAGSASSLAATKEIREGASFEAAVESLAPGDVLVVHQGTYADSGRISIGVKGTAASPVVIQGAAGEARPLITRRAGDAAQNTINIEGATYLTITGLEISSNGGDGINMNSNVAYITLEDLDIHDVDVGINFRSSMHHITVRRNRIHGTGANTGTGEGMYVGCDDGSCAVSDSIIEGNWVHNTLGATQGDGIEIKKGSHSNIVRDNVIYDTHYPCILLYGTQGNPRNLVERNVMWNCGDSGIQAAADAIIRNNIILSSPSNAFNSQDHNGVTPQNLEFVHNTIVGAGIGLRLSNWADKTGLVLANNAVYCGSGGYAISGVNGVVVTGNVLLPSTSSLPSSGYRTGRSIAQDFVDAASRNVYPSADSPLIDAGNAARAVADDFNCTSRSGTPESGAYAWSGGSNPGWSVGPAFKPPCGVSQDPPQPPANVRVR